MKIEHLTFSYDDKQIFDDFCLDIQNGIITALMAPSGKGKTTLLRLIAGLLTPQGGSINLQGQSVGIMFQEPRLFGQLTVLQNVMIVIKENCDKQKRAMDLLHTFGVAAAADQYPEELSGGMAKRVSLARAIAYDPDVLLLDEPFSALDAETKEYIMQATKSLLCGKTVLFVTHDVREAAAFSDCTVTI